MLAAPASCMPGKPCAAVDAACWLPQASDAWPCTHADAGMAHVAKLTSLECLDLFGARISDAGCASIG